MSGDFLSTAKYFVHLASQTWRRVCERMAFVYCRKPAVPATRFVFFPECALVDYFCQCRPVYCIVEEASTSCPPDFVWYCSCGMFRLLLYCIYHVAVHQQATVRSLGMGGVASMHHGFCVCTASLYSLYPLSGQRAWFSQLQVHSGNLQVWRLCTTSVYIVHHSCPSAGFRENSRRKGEPVVRRSGVSVMLSRRKFTVFSILVYNNQSQQKLQEKAWQTDQGQTNSTTLLIVQFVTNKMFVEIKTDHKLRTVYFF